MSNPCSTFYTPNAVVPTMTSLFSSSGSPSPGTYPLGGTAADAISKWTVLSKKRMKRRLREWKPTNDWGMININVLEYSVDGIPSKYASKVFFMCIKEDFDKFVVELGNLMDTCGIVRLRHGEIWFKEATSESELNVDIKIFDMIMDALRRIDK